MGICRVYVSLGKSFSGRSSSRGDPRRAFPCAASLSICLTFLETARTHPLFCGMECFCCLVVIAGTAITDDDDDERGEEEEDIMAKKMTCGVV